MGTSHKIYFANCMSMEELENESVHLIVTSPPYFNAPFDYKGLFTNYTSYLNMLKIFSKESFRVLKQGRIFVLNIDDMLVDGVKYPIVADATKIMLESGYKYRDRIIWKKPDGYLRISKRSGVLLQNPYPMYFYPDNLLESIIIFQKGKFNYKSVTNKVREESKVNTTEFKKNGWYKTIWEMTNVLPGSVLERNIAAFPDELPSRIIKLFSYAGDTVLDPFAGSGTTMKVSRELKRNSIGYEIIRDLEEVIKKKTGFINVYEEQSDDRLEIFERKSGVYRCVSLQTIQKRMNQKGD